MYILVATWFAASFHAGSTQYYPQMTFQEFNTIERCEETAQKIKYAFSSNERYKITTFCVKK